MTDLSSSEGEAWSHADHIRRPPCTDQHAVHGVHGVHAQRATDLTPRAALRAARACTPTVQNRPCILAVNGRRWCRARPRARHHRRPVHGVHAGSAHALHGLARCARACGRSVLCTAAIAGRDRTLRTSSRAPALKAQTSHAGVPEEQPEVLPRSTRCGSRRQSRGCGSPGCGYRPRIDSELEMASGDTLRDGLGFRCWFRWRFRRPGDLGKLLARIRACDAPLRPASGCTGAPMPACEFHLRQAIAFCDRWRPVLHGRPDGFIGQHCLNQEVAGVSCSAAVIASSGDHGCLGPASPVHRARSVRDAADALQARPSRSAGRGSAATWPCTVHRARRVQPEACAVHASPRGQSVHGTWRQPCTADACAMFVHGPGWPAA